MGRAATSHLLHVPGPTAQRARERLKYDPLARAVSGTAHGSSGRVVLGPGQISHATCWPI
jgi:hypothetical protein